MASVRFSIARLMGFVLVAALGAGGLRASDEPWASGCFTLMVVALTMAILQAIQGRGRGRGYWAGFASAGWVYFAVLFGMGSGRVDTPPFLTELLFNRLETLIHPATANTYTSSFDITSTTSALTTSPSTVFFTSPPPTPTPTVATPSPAPTQIAVVSALPNPAPLPAPPASPVPFLMTAPSNMTLIHYRQVARSLAGLLAGMLGGWTSLWLAARRERREAEPIGEPISPSSP